MTSRERDTLDYIIKFKQTNGYSPTISEISKGIFTSNRQHILLMLEHLQNEGYITYKHKSPRTIVVTKFL